MFDLDFFKKLHYCISVATSENPQLRIVSPQHGLKLKKELKLVQVSNWEDQMNFFGWDMDNMSTLLDYVYDEYVPSFGLKVVDASMKLVSVADKTAFRMKS